jgi:hypothetical protein
VSADVHITDRLLDLRHVTGDALASGHSTAGSSRSRERYGVRTDEEDHHKAKYEKTAPDAALDG